MFILVKDNDNYLESIKEAKKYNYEVVTMFNLILNGKERIRNQLKEIQEKKQKLKPKYSAIIVTAQNIENSSVGTVNMLKQDFDLVIGMGGLNKSNRFFIEDTKIDFLLDSQNSKFKSKIDFIHHFNSGINQVLGKMARDKEIGLIFSLNFTQSNNKIVSKEIGRINQNIKFARKYNLPVYINFLIENKFQIKSQIQIDSIYSLFDTDTKQKNNNKNVIEDKIIKNRELKSDKYIAQGIRLAD